jgi:hypothetical protein
MMELLAIFVAFFFLFTLVSGRLERTVLFFMAIAAAKIEGDPIFAHGLSPRVGIELYTRKLGAPAAAALSLKEPDDQRRCESL